MGIGREQQLLVAQVVWMGAAVSRMAQAAGPASRGQEGDHLLQPGRWCEMCEFGKCGVGTRVTPAAAWCTRSRRTGTAPGSARMPMCISMYGHSGGVSPRPTQRGTAMGLMGRGGTLRNLGRQDDGVTLRGWFGRHV